MKKIVAFFVVPRRDCCLLQPLISLLILILISASTFGQQKNYVSKVWVADNGDGTYKNPVLNADYSDPDVIRVGDDFYLVASSFEDIPGLPILHSKDLVNWEIFVTIRWEQPINF